MDPLRDSEALFRGAYGRFERLLESHLAEPLEQLGPAVNRARHRGGVDTLIGHPRLLVVSEFGEVVRCPRTRGPATGVEPIQLAIRTRVVEDECVPADPVTVRFDDREHRG